MDEWTNLLRALFDANVRFLIIGGYAAIAHGNARATEDLDIWLDPTLENVQAALNALKTFGVSFDHIEAQSLLDPYSFFRVGTQSGRKIDVMSHAEELDFASAWVNRFETDFAGLSIPFLGLAELIKNKRAIGRHKDLADVESLENFHRLRKQKIRIKSQN